MKLDTLAQELAQAEIFNTLPYSECMELAKVAQPRELTKGEFLCYEGDIWPNVVFLSTGQLRWAMLSAGGREYVLFLVKPGALFWGHSIVDDQPMPASLNATQSSKIYLWPRQVIVPVLHRNPGTMWEITRVLVRTMRTAREVIYGLAFRPVAGRLANLLLDRFPCEEGVVERDLTLSEMASMVATSPEVVCRLLQQFQTDGLLEITRASLALRDRPAMERLVQED